jgi:hypothetical protein
MTDGARLGSPRPFLPLSSCQAQTLPQPLRADPPCPSALARAGGQVVTPQFSGDADPPRGGALHAGCPRIKSSDSQQHTWGYVCGMEPCKYLQPVPSAKGDSISKFHIRISESRKQLKILAILARSQIPEPGGDSHLAARTSRCLPACIGARQSNSLKPRGALEQDTQNRAKPHPPPNSNQRISQQ